MTAASDDDPNPEFRLEVRGARKAFDGVVALDDVGLQVRPGEVHALVGENGAGKSTLIAVIAGVLAPDQGAVRLDGRPLAGLDPAAVRRQGVATVFQEAEFFPTLSIAENMALPVGLPTLAGGRVDWRTVERSARETFERWGTPCDVRLDAGRLSVAQRQLVQIAAAIDRRARLLILDEPTAALSDREAEWLFQRIRDLRAAGGSILYVSHRQDEIFALADRITVLRDGRNAWSGAASDTSREALVRHMVGRHVPPGVRRRRAVVRPPLAPSAGPAALSGLAVHRLDDAAGRFRDVDLHVARGEIVGLYGLVGAGRSEFAQALAGFRPCVAGTVAVDGVETPSGDPRRAIAAGIVYLPEDRLRDAAFPGRSLRENIVVATLRRWSFGGWWSRRDRELAAARDVLDRFAVRCRTPDDELRTLSGGNQQKTILGRWLLAEPSVLCLDEPTRGIDVAAKDDVHRRLDELADEGRAILLVSSDLPEVLACSDRVYVMRQGTLVGPFDPRDATPEAIAAAALPEERPAPSRTGAATRSESRAAKDGAGEADGGSWRRLVRESVGEGALALVVVVLAAALATTSHGFDVGALAAAASIWVLLGLAAALVIAAGGIDISLGALLALSAAAGAFVLKSSLPPSVAIPAALAVSCVVGAAGGLVNAALSLAGRLHPIVVTLGAMTVYRGLVVTLLGRKAMTGLPASLGLWSYEPATGIRGPLVAALFAALAAAVWLRHYPSGRALLACGASPAAARLAGISRRRVWCAAFGVGGALAGLAGFLQLAQSGQMQAQLGAGWELTAIAVAVLGGTSIRGGRLSVTGVVLGALLLRLVNSALVRWGVADERAELFTGLMLLAAVLVDLGWRRFRGA